MPLKGFGGAGVLDVVGKPRRTPGRLKVVFARQPADITFSLTVNCHETTR